jgi:hypothetical protein
MVYLNDNNISGIIVVTAGALVLLHYYHNTLHCATLANYHTWVTVTTVPYPHS